jgi:hypothetical protein
MAKRGISMSKSVNMKSSLYLFIFFLWLSVTPITSFAEWTTETVDSSGDVEGYTSMATDSNNNVHISYYDGSNRDLKYATNASGSWVTETVDSAGMVGWFTSIATDSNNKVHISYLDVYNCNLKYATNTSGSWVTETVDSAQTQMEPSSEYTSIAVGLNDWVHISYYDLFGGLKYATNIQIPWFTQSVDSAAVYAGMGNSVAITSGLKVHISYFGDGDLKYATGYPSGPWDIQTVDRGVYRLWQFSSIVNTSIATDSNNKVHISYYDLSNGDLKYATAYPSGSWVIQTVDSTGDVGGDTSIATDSNNKVHISYYDGSNRDLKYATNASGSWVTETVDSAGINTSIVIANNKVHISYATNGDLKYATNVVPDTTAPTTTASPAGGTYSSAQSVTLTCNDGSGSGCNTTYYCLGSGCNPTEIYSGSINISSSTTLRFRSIDNDGNLESVKTQLYTINTGCPVVTVNLPNGGEIIPSGSQYSIGWCAPSQAVKFTLKYSIDNGSTWKLIAKNITGTSYNWTVPTPANNRKECLVKVMGYNASGTQVGSDKSNSTFTIEVVKLTSPDGEEILQQSNTHIITWQTNATIRLVAQVKLSYSVNGGTSWTAVKTLTGNPGSYNWTVPNVSSSSCKVKVVLKDSGGVTVGNDISDGVFTIQQ